MTEPFFCKCDNVPQTKFLRELGGILRASVRVAKDDRGEEMIFPWEGSDTDSAIVDNNLKRVKRFLSSMWGSEEEQNPLPHRERRTVLFG